MSNQNDTKNKNTEQEIEEVLEEKGSENDLREQNDETLSFEVENNEEESLENQVERLKEQIQDLNSLIKDNELRSAAHIQNINRRHQKELDDAHKYATNNFATEMLTIKDYLEMALSDQSGNFDALKMGVDMTLKQLNSAFEKVNISEINPMGEKLDPNRHNCIKVEESPEEPNTVIGVKQKGYEMNGRILRPAMVVVSKIEE